MDGDSTGHSRTVAHPSARQLTWILAWAVVFCDIGTSVYYVPGILFHQVGDLAPYFVGLVTLAFIALAQKYTEVSWRNPEGGGVVTVARKAFGPWWGALGGILISIDYFLTSAISSVSGFTYLSSVVPGLAGHITILAALGLILLGFLNIIGIRESATAALVMAVASLATTLVTAGLALAQFGPEEIGHLLEAGRQFRTLSPHLIVAGFAGSWLAFSGLESISQLSPAMRRPLARTARWAMAAVVLTIILTSPVLTAASIASLPAEMKAASTETFISDLAGLQGGVWLKVSVVAAASTMLLFAANTAMIGGYHVFMALSQERFFPRLLARRNERFSTPHWTILVTVAVPVATIALTRGHVNLLGEMYSFGLLGAFTFTSFGLDRIRWREGTRGSLYLVGIVITVILAGSWAVNIVEKPYATAYGSVLTLAGLGLALAVRRQWVVGALNRLPAVARRAERIRHRIEVEVEDELEIVGLEAAVAMMPLYRSSTLVAILGTNPKLVSTALARVRGMGQDAIYLMSVTEWPGLFSGAENRPSRLTTAALTEMGRLCRSRGVLAIPVWVAGPDAARALSDAAVRLGCDAVFLGVSQRSALYHMLRGSVLRGLARRLPDRVSLVTVS